MAKATGKSSSTGKFDEHGVPFRLEMVSRIAELATRYSHLSDATLRREAWGDLRRISALALLEQPCALGN
jgi:hypothetical protein